MSGAEARHKVLIVEDETLVAMLIEDPGTKFPPNGYQPIQLAFGAVCQLWCMTPFGAIAKASIRPSSFVPMNVLPARAPGGGGGGGGGGAVLLHGAL